MRNEEFSRCVEQSNFTVTSALLITAANAQVNPDDTLNKMAMANAMTISIGSSGNGRDRSRSNSNGSTTFANREQFPSKLYEMLESVESLGLSHIVCWVPDGKAFQVVDPTQFMDLVVPKFFKATKYRSFQRQLNLWGFKRIVIDQDNNASWSHEYFIRGRPEFISKISRTRIKGWGRPGATGIQNQNEEQMQMQKMDSEEIVETAIYHDFKEDFDNFSCVSDSTRKISNAMKCTVIAPLGKVKAFDEKFKSEKAPSHISGCTNIEQIRLEPLPIDSAGILDATDNIDLAEFGELLGRL